MVTKAKKAPHPRNAVSSGGAVVYRGIKIAPMPGKRSAISKILRDELLGRSKQVRGLASQR